MSSSCSDAAPHTVDQLPVRFAVAFALAALALDAALAPTLRVTPAPTRVACVVWLRCAALLALGAASRSDGLHRVPTRGVVRRPAVALTAALTTAVTLCAVLPSLDVTSLATAVAAAPPLAVAPAGAALTNVLFAPLVEELLYRHLPVSLLARDDARPTRLLPALALLQLAFAASHLPRLCAPPSARCLAEALPTLGELALAGSALAALALATRALAPLVLVHASANLLVLLLGPALPLAAWRSWVAGSATVLALVWPARADARP